MTAEVKYVVVERNYRGRSVALRGISYPTKAEAEAHITEKITPRFRDRFHVESRAIKANDEGERMHCQCCGRAILAKLGTIAHHGYERPDYGYQTASCMGAKELPFEVDRKVLGRLIVALTEMKRRMQGVRDQIAEEILPIKRSYKVGYDRKEEKKSFDFTRANFKTDEARKALRDSGRYESEFDDLLKVELSFHDHKIESIGRDIRDHQKRFKDWKPTHEWKGGQWAAL